MKNTLYTTWKLLQGSKHRLFTLAFLLSIFAAGNSFAQSPSSYSFAQSSGTYSAIAGTTSTATGDDGVQGGIAMGFTFTYNGTPFTTISLTTNGCISLGSTTSSSWYSNSLNAFSGTPKINFIAPLWDDDNLTGGNIQYLLTGSGTSHVFTVQWTNDHIGGTGSSSNPTATFQVKFFETTNVIQFIYGGTSGALSGTTASIGISGAVGNFLSVTPGSPATASNSSANNSISSATLFPSGTIYTFTPPVPCTGRPAPGTIASTASYCGASGTVSLSVTGFTTGVSGITFQWNEATVNPVTGPWSPAAGTGATTSSFTSASFSGTKYFHVVVTCSASGLSDSTNTSTASQANCEWSVTRNTGVPYTSIISTGSTYSLLSSSDDGATNAISLAGTSFRYQGNAVTGFYAVTNGWMSLNTALVATNYTNDLTSTAQTKVLAPFWDDLVLKGNTTANQNSCMRYKINGTLGSGSADIIVEWADMERYQYGAPNINFQVVLHEAGNTIDFNYGNMQLYDGSVNGPSLYSYSVGMNGSTPSGTTLSDHFVLQRENTAFFSTTNQTALSLSPACFSQLHYVPAAAYTGVDPGAPGIPVNDEPAGAINLAVNPSPCISICNNIYTSANATASAGIPVCGAATPGTPDDDVFFSFLTTGQNQYRIDVTPSINYDAVVQVFDQAMNPIACVNANGVGLGESMTANLAPGGQLYYVQVYHAGTTIGSSNGEFAICVSEVIPPPTNDECNGATPLQIDATCNPTQSEQPATLSATASLGVPVCSASTPGIPDDDVWYYFTTNPTPSGVYVVTVNGVGTYNAVLQIFNGDCNTLSALACVNATGNGGTETFTSSTLTPGTNYWLRVYNQGTGAANGNFNICVTAPIPSCLTLPTSPANGAILCQSVSNTILSWPSTLNATGYDVYFDNGSGMNLVSGNQAGTTYDARLLAPGNYSWQIVPMNGNGAPIGCPVWTFQVVAGPSVTVTPVSQSFCGTGSVVLSALGATSYSWNPTTGLSPTSGSPVTATVSTSTIYTVTGTDINNCTASATSAITVNAAVSVSVAAVPSSVCVGGNSVLTATGAIANANVYCPGVSTYYTTGTSFSDFITNVTLGSINNTTGASASPYNTYYNLLNTNLTAGLPYTLNGTISNGGTEDVAAWIDYNQNGVFEASEKLGEQQTLTYSIAFTVPAGAYNGTTRMRVRNVYSTTNIDPCATYSYGEIEDYNVTISNGVTPPATLTYTWNPTTYLSPTTGAVVTSTPGATTTYTVTATAATGCSATASATVTLLSSAPPTGITASATEYCASNCSGPSVPVVLTALGTLSPGHNWVWYTGSCGGVLAGTGPSISVTPAVATTYYVRAEGPCGNSTCLSILITVHP